MIWFDIFIRSARKTEKAPEINQPAAITFREQNSIGRAAVFVWAMRDLQLYM